MLILEVGLMRNYRLLAASILSLAMIGCSSTQPVEALPPVSGVPLASFMAFKTDPGLEEVPSGDTISANKWALLVPRFVNNPDPRNTADKNDWVVLPLALDTQELCEKEASALTQQVEVAIETSDITSDGTALKGGSVGRCVRSDGSSRFVANSAAL